MKGANFIKKHLKNTLNYSQIRLPHLPAATRTLPHHWRFEQNRGPKVPTREAHRWPEEMWEGSFYKRNISCESGQGAKKQLNNWKMERQVAFIFKFAGRDVTLCNCMVEKDEILWEKTVEIMKFAANNWSFNALILNSAQCMYPKIILCIFIAVMITTDSLGKLSIFRIQSGKFNFTVVIMCTVKSQRRISINIYHWIKTNKEIGTNRWLINTTFPIRCLHLPRPISWRCRIWRLQHRKMIPLHFQCVLKFKNITYFT